MEKRDYVLLEAHMQTQVQDANKRESALKSTIDSLNQELSKVSEELDETQKELQANIVIEDFNELSEKFENLKVLTTSKINNLEKKNTVL